MTNITITERNTGATHNLADILSEFATQEFATMPADCGYDAALVDWVYEWSGENEGWSWTGRADAEIEVGLEDEIIAKFGRPSVDKANQDLEWLVGKKVDLPESGKFEIYVSRVDTYPRTTIYTYDVRELVAFPDGAIVDSSAKECRHYTSSAAAKVQVRRIHAAQSGEAYQGMGMSFVSNMHREGANFERALAELRALLGE